MPFTEDHHAFRRVVREYVEKEINPHIDAWEQDGLMPLHAIFTQMAELGFLGLEYDPAYGGQGADHLFTAVLAEEFGRADHGSIGMALGVQVDMATPSLHRFGTPEQKERFLAPALRGEAVAAIAVTEPGAGSDVGAIRTRAVKDGDEWVLNGSKTFITNSVQADWLCLLARTSDESAGYGGMSQIIVPTDLPGLEVSNKLDKLGMRASDTALLTFTDVKVPVDNTLGEAGRGFQQQMSQFVQERMWANYSTVGSIDRALERTREYTRQRQVFGKPLAASDFVAFKLAELAAEVDLLRHYNYAAAQAVTEDEDVTRFATIGKYKAGKLSREVADWCLQFHGGIGYMEETWTARFLRDSRLTGIGGGADEVMLDVLARLDGYRS
ncbi:MAG: acyl-CoA dehydrogenase [bacterium]|nr:acyl-CoA dehydrogenase [bacterium]